MAIIAKETIISHLESTEEFPIALSDVWEWLGYARKDNALKGFLRLEMAESIDFIQFRQEEEHSLKDSLEVKMTIDCFKLWAMSAQTAKGKEVRLYYLQIEKEWKASRAEPLQLSADQFQSFKHEFETFRPWATEHPIAATIFLERQGITPIVLDPTPVLTSAPPIESQALPSAETMAALDGAFLNLNRSGLMMNKLFHFLDRIPTMKALDEDFVNELVNGLSESERLRVSLEDELSGALKRLRKLKEDYERTLKELRLKTMELDTLSQRCQTCESIPTVESPVYSGKAPRSLKPAT